MPSRLKVTRASVPPSAIQARLTACGPSDGQVGVAVNLTMLTGGTTVTVTVAVTDPAEFVAVKVKVVVSLSVTVLAPLTVTGPIPLIEALVAPVVCHVRPLEPPVVMVAVLATNELMIGPGIRVEVVVGVIGVAVKVAVTEVVGVGVGVSVGVAVGVFVGVAVTTGV